MSLSLEAIVASIKQASLRVTKSRLAVAKILLEHPSQFLTPEEIFQIIQKKSDSSCDQVSVYRILARFEELGIVKKSEFQKEAARYMLHEPTEHHHEHYFKCTECLTIEPFTDCLISKKEKELHANGYRNLHHHLEITGLCPTCAP